ncbi:hypothetical protein OG565_33975 (plasmid) [Streptomyces sp. NBC_00138]|uniref:hypothetical protein n=1 Tax=Streptomyces sp. NBC_00138 TaxID=2903625 RepID=UPI002F91B04A
MSTFNVVQPEIHTAPIGSPAVWDPIMNRSGGRCECTGSCGRSHSRTEFRCDRHHDRGAVRLVVAPLDLALPLEQAVRLPVAELRAWCPDCHRLARRRHREAAAHRKLRQQPPAEGLFDL